MARDANIGIVIHQELEEFYQLIAEVQEINSEAAEYLSTGARNMPSFSPCNGLSAVFLWKNTPQGHDYWAAIDKQLDERRQQND